MTIQDDEVLSFVAEDEEEVSLVPRNTWRVLIVDDDEMVHRATRLALDEVVIYHRRLELVSAYSAAEALAFLKDNPDIAVILLDVVMETDDAGLRLVRAIREDLKMIDVRIILRTGQPGQAPEVDVIRAYDINDYKSKSELTRTKLFTALTGAIRTFEQIQMLRANRNGLSKVIESSSRLLAVQGLQEFAQGVIIQLTGLLGMEPEGLLCVEARGVAHEALVIAAAGRFGTLLSQPIAALTDESARRSIERAFTRRANDFAGDGVALFIGCRSPRDLVAYIRTPHMLSQLDTQLLEVFCTNISIGFENVNMFTHLQETAYKDMLTGLPNRRSLEESLPAMLTGNLLLLDLHQFSEINDVLGFEVGNELLKAVAARLRGRVPPEAMVARVGGDMFAVCGQGFEPQALVDLLNEPFDAAGNEIALFGSFGSARFGSGSEAKQSLQSAGVALRQAKLQGRGCLVQYADSMGAHAKERMGLLQELRQAVHQNALSLAYQPQVSLADGALVGVEALLRWVKPDVTNIPPDRFIALAESSGLIVPIGEWVLRTAVREMKAFATRHAIPLRVSVNVSAVQFSRPDFFAALEQTVQEAGQQLELEIEVTESIAMSDPAFFSEVLDRVSALGVSVAIDDFGTGHSSLSYLQELKIDRLKVDRSFVQNIDADRGFRIVQAIVQLGQSLDLTVIAEGVETSQEQHLLTLLGCNEGQGYLFGKPMFSPALDDWWSAKRQAS